jgi:hypothetical protein
MRFRKEAKNSYKKLTNVTRSLHGSIGARMKRNTNLSPPLQAFQDFKLLVIPEAAVGQGSDHTGVRSR